MSKLMLVCALILVGLALMLIPPGPFWYLAVAVFALLFLAIMVSSSRSIWRFMHRA